MDLDVIKTIDNVNTTLASDLKESITPNSKLQIAAACFSIYAYQELKSQLEDISELQFIFTSPTFTTEECAEWIKNKVTFKSNILTRTFF